MLNHPLFRSPTLRVLASAAAIYAIYLPLATWLHRPVVAPPGAMVIRLTPVQPSSRYGGFAFESSLAEFEVFEEFSGPKFVASPVLLYEDDKPLGPSVHHELESISRFGEGRYSHWNHEGMIFSTSDNSDPRKNGRKYWAVLPETNDGVGGRIR
jgi:hypothetical protein